MLPATSAGQAVAESDDVVQQPPKYQVSNSKRSHEAPFVIWSLELGSSDLQFPTSLLIYVLCRRPHDLFQQPPRLLDLDYGAEWNAFWELLPAVEERQLDKEGKADNLGSGPLHQACHSSRRAACGDHVVVDEHPVSPP